MNCKIIRCVKFPKLPTFIKQLYLGLSSDLKNVELGTSKKSWQAQENYRKSGKNSCAGLKKRLLFKCNPVTKKFKLRYCKVNNSENTCQIWPPITNSEKNADLWKTVVFSDKTMLELNNDRLLRVRRPKNRRFEPQFLAKFNGFSRKKNDDLGVHSIKRRQTTNSHQKQSGF